MNAPSSIETAAHTALNAVLQNPDRLAALQRVGLLDTPTEEAFDRLTRLAAALMHAPIAMVTLVDRNRQFIKSCVGVPQPVAEAHETMLSSLFCRQTVALNAPLIVEDAHRQASGAYNLPVVDSGTVAYAGMPLSTANGQVVGALCVLDTCPRRWTSQEISMLQDIAAATMTEIEMRVMTQATRQALQQRDTLVSIMSHDLKNPLTTIKGYVDLIRRRMRRENQANLEQISDGLAKIEVATNKIMGLLDDMVDVARLQAETQRDLQYRAADLIKLVHQVVAEHQPMTTVHQIMVVTTLPVLELQCDPALIERVLTNLVTNAIKYSPTGGQVEIQVLQVVVADQHWAIVSVRDEGMGIPVTDLGRIFEQFHRGSNAVGRFSGTGIGLASAHQAVTQHGGTLTVDSTEGAGSTFTIRLPLERPITHNIKQTRPQPDV